VRKDHEPQRETQRDKQERQQTESAYRSVRSRLSQIWDSEALLDKQSRKRTGVTDPVRIIGPYGQKSKELSPEFYTALQRIWDLGSLPGGRADVEVRRVYHLIARGRAPMTETDVIKLGAMSEPQLRQLLPWLAHRLSLAEAQDNVDFGKVAPPIIIEEVM
jgi:hypothetical protein